MTNEYAFPSDIKVGEDEWTATGGMSLRDYFAAKAMNRMIVRAELHFATQDPHEPIEWEYFHEYVGTQSYLIADAMLKARSTA